LQVVFHNDFSIIIYAEVKQTKMRTLSIYLITAAGMYPCSSIYKPHIANEFHIVICSSFYIFEIVLNFQCFKELWYYR